MPQEECRGRSEPPHDATMRLRAHTQKNAEAPCSPRKIPTKKKMNPKGVLETQQDKDWEKGNRWALIVHVTIPLQKRSDEWWSHGLHVIWRKVVVRNSEFLTLSAARTRESSNLCKERSDCAKRNVVGHSWLSGELLTHFLAAY